MRAPVRAAVPSGAMAGTEGSRGRRHRRIPAKRGSLSASPGVDGSQSSSTPPDADATSMKGRVPMAVLLGVAAASAVLIALVAGGGAGAPPAAGGTRGAGGGHATAGAPPGPGAGAGS